MFEQQRPPHVVIGTAGHIDHGKTTLVKALTGTDTDKLKEEKQRGITIELGFAFYSDRAAFVDVPGHERLVKTMIAGASAMRAALLVVAADDGVMPQTREHLAVLDAMGVEKGIVAVTKADLVDEEWAALVEEEVKELLEPTSLHGSPVHVVDSISGRGIDELKGSLDALIDSTTGWEDPGFFRMPVDRSFLIKGHGRVVTGTVWSGAIEAGKKLVLLPDGKDFRVRGMQAHETAVDQVRTGDRAALNLSGDGEPERGDQLTVEGRGTAESFLDIQISLLPNARPVKHRMRVRLHLGTAESIGRVLLVGTDQIESGEKGFARIDLESSIPCMLGDRGVLRLYSPVETLGGVRVLDPQPPDKKRNQAHLENRISLLAGTDADVVCGLIQSRIWMTEKTIVRLLPWRMERIQSALQNNINAGQILRIEAVDNVYVISNIWMNWVGNTKEILEAYHNRFPEESGMTKAAWLEEVTGMTLPDEITSGLLRELESSGDYRFADGALGMSSHVVHLRKADEEPAEKILVVVRDAGINAPLQATIAESLGMKTEEVRRLLRALKLMGKVIILDERVVVSIEAVALAKEKLLENFKPGELFTVGQAAEKLESTRKYMIPLLEYFDAQGLTERVDDQRCITEG